VPSVAAAASARNWHARKTPTAANSSGTGFAPTATPRHSVPTAAPARHTREGILRAGELAARAMEKHGDTVEARIRREDTYEELRAYKEDYRKGFHSEEIQSLSRTALSGPGTSTENPVDVLKNIDLKMQQLIDKMGTPRARPLSLSPE
jgi:hypothetical protein